MEAQAIDPLHVPVPGHGHEHTGHKADARAQGPEHLVAAEGQKRRHAVKDQRQHQGQDIDDGGG